jgi:hypothetical protein
VREEVRQKVRPSAALSEWCVIRPALRLGRPQVPFAGERILSMIHEVAARNKARLPASGHLRRQGRKPSWFRVAKCKLHA